jgi:hypothetical protein
MPARAVSQTLRSLTSETHRKPVRTMKSAPGTAGRDFTVLFKLIELGGGGCRSSLPRLASLSLMGSAMLLQVQTSLQVQEILVGDSSVDKLVFKMASCGVTVREAFAAGATSSKNGMDSNSAILKTTVSGL